MKQSFILYIIIVTITLLRPMYTGAQVLFQTGQSLSTGIDAEVVCVGDVNNDGLEDIVTATGTWFNSPFDYKLFVYIQSGTGTFPVTVNYSYSHFYPGIDAMDIKDVNNDTYNDVIIGYGDSIGIFFQNSMGTLDAMISYYSGTDVDDLKVGDLNNDGLNDIVVCHWNANYLKIFYQSVSGYTTGMYTKTAGGYDEIEIGDVNSDGLNDVVYMAGQGLGGIHVYTQNVAGTLNNYVSYFASGGVFQSLNGIVIGDVNNDGANDVIAARGGNLPTAQVVFWYQDTVTKLLNPPASTPAYEVPANIGLADFNCDGKPEIFINHNGWNAITIWSPDSAGNYINYDRYSVSIAQHPKPEGMTSGDFNHDGKLDIVSLGGIASIQLLYNISIPENFSYIDTVMIVDTIYSQSIISNSYYTVITIDSIIGGAVINTDSFHVYENYQLDSILYDAVYTRTGSICGSAYSDIITDSSLIITAIGNTDTMFWSNTMDTIVFPSIPPPNIFEIIVSPNPFVNQIEFACSCNNSMHFSFYDGVGRIIHKEEFQNSIIVDTEDLAGGVYFYQFRDERGATRSGKVIRQ